MTASIPTQCDACGDLSYNGPNSSQRAAEHTGVRQNSLSVQSEGILAVSSLLYPHTFAETV